MAVLHGFGLFFLFAATVLLVIVSVSAPVWKNVYFLHANLASASSTIDTSSSSYLRMGNWGLCVANACTKSRLGYNLSFIENNTSDSAEVASAVVHGLTYALVLNPIAAGFTFFALLFGLGTHLITGILASLLSALAFLITLVAFIIDLVLFLTARHRLNNLSNTHATLGNAIWLVLVALLLQLLASVTVCFTHHRRQRRARGTGVVGGNNTVVGGNNTVGEPVMTQTTSGRTWYGKRRTGAAYV